VNYNLTIKGTATAEELQKALVVFSEILLTHQQDMPRHLSAKENGVKLIISPDVKDDRWYIPKSFDEIGQGRTIRHIIFQDPHVVCANYGDRVTAVRLADITNLPEWELLK